MPIFIKVEALDRCVDKFTTTYINVNNIYFLTILTEDDEKIYLAYMGDVAIRLSRSSWESVARIVYGKEHENA